MFSEWPWDGEVVAPAERPFPASQPPGAPPRPDLQPGPGGEGAQPGRGRDEGPTHRIPQSAPAGAFARLGVHAGPGRGDPGRARWTGRVPSVSRSAPRRHPGGPAARPAGCAGDVPGPRRAPGPGREARRRELGRAGSGRLQLAAGTPGWLRFRGGTWPRRLRFPGPGDEAPLRGDDSPGRARAASPAFGNSVSQSSTAPRTSRPARPATRALPLRGLGPVCIVASGSLHG